MTKTTATMRPARRGERRTLPLPGQQADIVHDPTVVSDVEAILVRAENKVGNRLGPRLGSLAKSVLEAELPRRVRRMLKKSRQRP